MNLLKNTKVYTVGAMQYANGQNWREKVYAELSPLNIKIFDPYHKPFVSEIQEDEAARLQLLTWMNNEEYDKVAERMRQVRSDDLRCTDLVDFAIVQIIPKVASWGSAEELTTLVRAKKPIFIFVEGGKKLTPVWVMGMLPHKYIYNSLDDTLTMIKKINSGEVKIDSTRWRLLKEEYR